MATILEVGADGETWRSEHSGRTVTSDKVGRVDEEGAVQFGEGQRRIWDHENKDFADEREPLQVGKEDATPRRPAAAGAAPGFTRDELAEFRQLLEERRAAAAGPEHEEPDSDEAPSS